jgi:hypothetical protein
MVESVPWVGLWQLQNSYYLHNCDLWPQIVFANKINTMKAKMKELMLAHKQQSVGSTFKPCIRTSNPD